MRPSPQRSSAWTPVASASLGWRAPRFDWRRTPFDHLAGVDLNGAYIVGDGNGALAVARRQLLVAGIRLAFLLDQNFGKP